MLQPQVGDGTSLPRVVYSTTVHQRRLFWKCRLFTSHLKVVRSTVAIALRMTYRQVGSHPPVHSSMAAYACTSPSVQGKSLEYLCPLVSILTLQ